MIRDTLLHLGIPVVTQLAREIPKRVGTSRATSELAAPVNGLVSLGEMTHGNSMHNLERNLIKGWRARMGSHPRRLHLSTRLAAFALASPLHVARRSYSDHNM